MKSYALNLALSALLAACSSGADEPQWQSLGGAGDAVRFASLPLSGHTFTEGLSRPIQLVEVDGEAYLQMTIKRAEWTFDASLDGGSWSAPVSLLGIGIPPGDLPSQSLGKGAVQYVHSAPNVLNESKPLELGTFHAFTNRVTLKLGDESEPPDGLELKVHAGRNGLSNGRHRAQGRLYAGEGFALLPGESVEIPVRLRAGSALSFATSSEPAVPVKAGEPLRFRVFLDDDQIFEYDVTRLGRSLIENHRIVIPDDAPKSARLRFEVSGPLSYASILAPTIGPLATGNYGTRPWEPSHPDIIVFLADTFRADNLEAYGGEPRLTPFLNSFASKATLFRRAWSTGTFTLPAHVSMFTGAYPRQAGIVGTGRALPEQWLTMAERLSECGYRTGAITDAGIVTQQFGLDQGFSYWDERGADMDSTLARTAAFLDADDGRPVFLFVQSYRAHLPYTVSAETRAELGDLLKLEGSFAALNERIKALSSGPVVPPSDPGQREEWFQTRAQLRDLYRGGSRDLDRGFESFYGDLQSRGLGGSYVVFTSDHGEGFLEHDVLYHTGKVWEELARIPLLFSGPDIPAQVTDVPASLIDLAPTIADLAGIEPEPDWLGRSLRMLPSTRPLFVFECRARFGSTVAILDSDHKVIAFEDRARLEGGELDGAYDLHQDPGELHRLAPKKAPWALELLRREALRAANLLDPLIDPTASRLDAEKTKQLGQLGYADE